VSSLLLLDYPHLENDWRFFRTLRQLSEVAIDNIAYYWNPVAVNLDEPQLLNIV